jgi:hypothetical protein
MIGKLHAYRVSKQHCACGASGHHLDNCPGGCARRLQHRRRLLRTLTQRLNGVDIALSVPEPCWYSVAMALPMLAQLSTGDGLLPLRVHGSLAALQTTRYDVAWPEQRFADTTKRCCAGMAAGIHIAVRLMTLVAMAQASCAAAVHAHATLEPGDLSLIGNAR